MTGIAPHIAHDHAWSLLAAAVLYILGVALAVISYTAWSRR